MPRLILVPLQRFQNRGPKPGQCAFQSHEEVLSEEVRAQVEGIGKMIPP